MACCWKNHHYCKRGHHFYALFCFCFCFCFCFYLIAFHGIHTCNPHSGARFVLSSNGDGSFSFFQKQEGEMVSIGSHGRKLVGGGLGSSPPRCTSKCEGCTPCTPVHVPVPPGTPVTMEYYPEAWRCKCGNKLFMP